MRIMEKLAKKDKLVKKTWDKIWKIDIKFGAFKFKEIRERLEVLEWETLYFYFMQFRGRSIMYKRIYLRT